MQKSKQELKNVEGLPERSLVTQKRRSFSWQNNDVLLKLKGESPYITVVYVYLSQHANNETREAWGSQRHIAKELKISKAMVNRSIQWLIGKKLLQIKKSKDQNYFTSHFILL